MAKIIDPDLLTDGATNNGASEVFISTSNKRINLHESGNLDSDGQLVLEIIADSMFFEPYTGKFEVKKSKNVTVERDEEDDDEDEKVIKPKVSVIKEEENHIPFTMFYKHFLKERINETKVFKNYKPSEEARNLAKKKINGSIDNEIDKIFMLYLDKFKIKS